jgi:hypothetical protein
LICLLTVSIFISCTAYAEKYKNTMTIKVDDVGFNKTNTGVWCNPLSELMDPITKTEWSSYQTDEVIEE